MVYIENIAESAVQSVQIPRSDGVATDAGLLRLVLKRGGRDWVFSSSDTSEDPKYYDLAIQGADALQAGEYAYSLFSEGEELSTGVAVVGEYHPGTKQYDSETKTVEYNG